MTKEQEAYYRTDHWQKIKLKVMEQHPDGCILTNDLEYDVHHLNYINLNREMIGWDVLPLGRTLHKEFHEWAKLNRKDFYDLEEFANYKRIRLSTSKRNRLKAAKIYNLDLRKKNEISKNPPKKIKAKKFKKYKKNKAVFAKTKIRR